MIGSGGYGQIYLAMDILKYEERAVKIEPRMRQESITKRMIMEQEALQSLQGKLHCPLMYASGYNDEFNFIVMQLLSENVGDIRKRSPTGRLSKESVGRIAWQTVNALRDIHEMGYVHRDVKPANICFGCHFENRHILYLLDFGLFRRFKDTTTGQRFPPRKNAGFKGTERYVSVRVHEKLEQTPLDDLFSVLYTSYELMVGEVPWRFLDDVEEIYAVKQLMNELGNNGEMFKGIASFLVDFHRLLVSCDPNDDPPYEKLMECLKKLFETKSLEDPYDWEDGFRITLNASFVEPK
ncbi:hypothetical protein CAEBREN_29195 [Caenorhabditis brenneri]|uniref:non-specific serine/threonine protein kinase n=1 Tax=Caenorhabditis brenneri TaxID=135651 RepID=G0MBX6_CAEBE|nr:hypothetical protein CAEBREN_29195 [Caenorhabditis brenneri]